MVSTGGYQNMQKGDMGVRKGLPEDRTQRMNPSWPAKAAEKLRVGKVKCIAGPRNDMNNSSVGGTALQ